MVQPRRWTTARRTARKNASLSAAAASLLLGTAVAAASLPDTIGVTGLVRDFQSAHADFQVMPAGGFGTYVGLVQAALDADGTPAWAGQGQRVISPATDNALRSIAPHLANVSCSGSGWSTPPLLTEGRIRGRNTAVFDAYDSSAGPYGGANIVDAIIATNAVTAGMLVIDNSSTLYGDGKVGPGGDPAVVADIQGTITGTVTNLTAAVPLPPVVEPVGLPVYPGGDLNVPMSSSMTISQSWHVQGEFDVKRNSTVTIDGNITILCDDRWLIGKDATVLIPDGSSLEIYCRSQARLYGTNTVVNPDTSDPGKLTIYMLGPDIYNHQVVMNGAGTTLCGRIVARNNIVDLDQRAELFGTFAGAAVEINNQSKLHVDMRDLGGGGMGSDPTMGDTAAVLDATISTGGVTSAATFADWFHDVPGVNLSQPLMINLVRQPDDTYLFDDTLDPKYQPLGGFYPVDGRLFGNEGVHNDHFTYILTLSFTHDAAAAQFFKCATDSDAWVFIDDQLVIDLGGVHGLADQRIDLDRMCLVDGETYWLAFLLADRYESMSSLRIETNILFEGSLLPSMTAAFD